MSKFRDTDGAGVAELVGPLHARPRPGCAALGPMHEVEVDVVDTQAFQAPFGFCGGVAPGRVELGGDENVLASHAALTQRVADAFFVAVRLSGVNVTVSQLQRPADGVDALRSVGHLPHSQGQNRDFLTVRQQARASTCVVGIRCHELSPSIRCWPFVAGHSSWPFVAGHSSLASIRCWAPAIELVAVLHFCLPHSRWSPPWARRDSVSQRRVAPSRRSAGGRC